MGTIQASMSTYLSEIRCYRRFCEMMGVVAIPADEITMKRFVTIFRCPDSAAKYVTAIRWAHVFLGFPTGEWDSPSLRQVIQGAIKLRCSPVRKAAAIRWPLLRQLVRHSRRRGLLEQACAYVLAANFMLRVPSECLPLRFDNLELHSQMREVQDGGKIALEISLNRRKNKPQGSVMVRSCRCPQDSVVCPVHCVSELVVTQNRQRRGKLFSLSETGFVRTLREHLSYLQVDSPKLYSSHSFRRGTAQELIASPGGRLVEVLKAGEWSSSSFLEYQDREEIDQLALLDVICEEDEDESLVGRVPDPKRRRGQTSLTDFWSRVG